MLLRLCAWCGLVAPVTFTVGWIAGSLAQPDMFSLVYDDVSELGALTADSPWLYNQIGANLTGVLVVVFAGGLWTAVPPGVSGRIGVIALGVTGVGLFLEGLLRLDVRTMDLGSDWGGDSSWHEISHQVNSIFTITLGLVVSVFALAASFEQSPRWRDLRTATLFTGIAMIAAFIGPVFLLREDIGDGAVDIGDGLAVITALSVWFAWLALVSYRLLSVATEQARSGPGLVAS